MGLDGTNEGTFILEIFTLSFTVWYFSKFINRQC